VPQGANVFVVAGLSVDGFVSNIFVTHVVLDDRWSGVAHDLLAVNRAMLGAPFAGFGAVAPGAFEPLWGAGLLVAGLGLFWPGRWVAKAQGHC